MDGRSFLGHHLLRRPSVSYKDHCTRWPVCPAASSPSESDGGDEHFWTLWEVAWAWRYRTKRAIWRTFPLALIALVNISAFITAGIFSSKVMKTDGEVLAVGQCGFLDESVAKPFETWTKNDWAAGDTLFVSAYIGWRSYSTYARSCYGSYLVKGPASCKSYPVPAIKSSINRTSPCPFAPGTCKESATALDTGVIDSNLHLGINARPKDRVQMRKITSCAPIAVEGKYNTDWVPAKEARPGTELYFDAMFPDDKYRYYDLGLSTLYGQIVSNFTFVLRNTSLTTSIRPYTLYASTSYAGNLSESGFLPIPDFNRTDADVTVILLNNKVAYTGEVTDSWFRASRRGKALGLEEVWFSSDILSGLACTEQWQFCNADRCTALSGVNNYKTATPDLGFNPQQVATYNIMRQYALQSGMIRIAQFIPDEILLAPQLVYGSLGISGPLPDKHWQKEVENFHNTTLAAIQGGASAHVWTDQVQIRPEIPFSEFLKLETDPEELNLCRNQKILNSGYTSFNMFGFMIIIILSAIIIAVNIFIADIVRWVYSTSGEQTPTFEWAEDHLLHLQRVALESRGVTNWEGGPDDIPVTTGFNAQIPRESTYSSSNSIQKIEQSNELLKHRKGQEMDQEK